MLEAKRFWDQTAPSGDCLLWTGQTNSDPVYGIFLALGGRLIAHRVAYELAFGPLPSHAHVGRVCRNDLCVSPQHLFLRNSGKSATPSLDEKKRVTSQVTVQENGCWLWGGKRPKCIALSVGIKTLPRGIYELYNGPIARGKDVVRTCSTAECLNPEHLGLTDKFRLGKSNSRLSEEQVREIRRLAHTGSVGLLELAERFGTSRQTIYTVVYNLGWHDPGYVPPAKMPRKPRSCRQGHVFDEANTIVLESGGRKCRICHQAAVDAKRERKSLQDRFWEKVDKSDADGCWPWTAYTHKGWGYFSVNRAPQLAHRVAYELTYGEVPRGFKVLHSCQNDSCMRPEHLFVDGGFRAEVGLAAK